MTSYVDYSKLHEAIKILKPNNELFEVRIMGKYNYSGYFKGYETLENEIKILERKGWLINEQCYITLNKIKDSCYAREQRDKLIRAKQTTSDNDIIKYEYVFIDIDPIRESGISSTDEELNEALNVRDDVYSFLNKRGFKDPIIARSGNGCHLLYKIDVLNTKENENYIHDFLKVLDLKFSNKAKIDTVNSNPSRICKLYGTLSQKGSDTKERPHRMAEIELPEMVEVNDFELVKQIASMYPKTETTVRYNNSSFSLDEFLKKHNIGVKEVVSDKGRTKYILESCPFNSEHNNDSPAVFQESNGTLGFKCFHNSCSNNGWKEFRNFYEPNYDPSTAQNPYMRKKEVYNGRRLFNIKEAITSKPESRERTTTGIKELDKMIGGFTYDAVTLWASQTNGGKTTLLTMLTDRFISQGKKVFYFNGEQTLDTFRDNLFLKRVKKDQVISIEYQDTGIYDDFISSDVYDDVLKFYADRLFVYNNEAPRDIDTMMMVLSRARSELGIRDFIIDNLMQIDIAGNDKLREQERLAEKLRTFAVNTKSNIHLVVHSRKTMGNSIRLNLFDIAGSQTIANKSYNIITIIRIDQLDNTSSEYERLRNDCMNDGYDIEELDGILEVLKYKYRRGRTGLVGLKYDRDLGTYIEVKKRPKYEIEITNAEREKANVGVKRKHNSNQNKEFY